MISRLLTFGSRRPAKRKRGKSITSIVKGNIKAALDNGLAIRVIKPDGEIVVGDVRELELNDWDEILPGNSNGEE